MRQPGRISADAASVIVPPEAALPTDCPPPPAHLGVRERAEWAAIIGRVGAALLPRETHGLLATFCAVEVQLETINEALAAFGARVPEDKQGWQRYRELTHMRAQVSSQQSSLATKLRLTPQSRVHRYAAGTQAQRRAGRLAPWAMHDDDPCAGSS